MTRRLFFPALLALASITCAPQDDRPRKDGVAVRPETIEAKPKIPEPLKARIDAALEVVHGRDLRTDNGFWTIFHGILGMGPQTTLLDPATGKRLNALDEICKGRDLVGLHFVVFPDGTVDVETKVGTGTFQGHQDQFIAEMAQWGMPRERKFVIEGKPHTFEDFIRHSRAEASTTRNQELSWAVVIVSEYFGTDHRWTNRFGETLTLEDLVAYELGQPIDKAACGGTHRLFGLTWAYHLHSAKGGKIVGVWKQVADKIEEYKKRAFDYQNPDGSFSSTYLAKPGHTTDLQTRIATTGHVFEWLALAATDKEIHDPRFEQAAAALALMILENQNSPLDGGALYHATHGLHIYSTRAFQTPPPPGLVIPPPPK